MNILSVGHDVEFFGKKDGVVVSMSGLLPGTKSEPVQLEGSAVGSTLQIDGVAIELGMSPVSGYRLFCDNFYQNYLEVNNVVTEAGFEIDTTRQAFLFEEKLKQEAMTLGCDADYDAWLETDTRRRDPFSGENFLTESGASARFTGGHIHFGYSECGVPKWAITKMLDIMVLGRDEQFLQTLLQRDDDRQWNRMDYYGRPGLYRPKPYGLEYRSPCNMWANDIIQHGDSGFIHRAITLVEAIVNSDAREIHNAFGMLPFDDFNAAWKEGSTAFRQWSDVSGGAVDRVYSYIINNVSKE